MSWQASSWAIEQQEVTDSNARFVLVILASYAGPDGQNSFPSVQRLCRDTGLSESTVRRSLSKLEEAALILRGNQAIAAAYIARMDKRPVVYDLMIHGVSHRHPAPSTGCQPDKSGVSHRPERGVTQTPNPILKSSIEPKSALTRAEKAEQKRAALAGPQALASLLAQPKKV
jgi:hypothetical protein